MLISNTSSVVESVQVFDRMSEIENCVPLQIDGIREVRACRSLPALLLYCDSDTGPDCFARQAPAVGEESR